MYPSHDCWAQVGDPPSSTILNDYHSDSPPIGEQEGLLEFPLFPRFPPEIRSAIWRCALQRYRLISIGVVHEGDNGPPPWARGDPWPYTARNRMGNTISGMKYHLNVVKDYRLSPLLRVSRESRQVVLRFYRVHIPCDWNAHGEQRLLYLSPEFDFLQLHPVGVPEILVDFVHDVRAYDPQGIGIRNMGVDVPQPDINGNSLLPMDPSSLAPLALSAFTATLTNLRRVIFHQIVHDADSRQMFDSLDMAKVRYNRSFPINGLAEAFDLMETDPRPIDADLDQVSVGWDPRRALCLWCQMERNFQIRRDERRLVEMQLLLTAPTHGTDGGKFSISSRPGADEFLQREKKLWRANWDEGAIFKRWGYVDPDTPEKLKSAPIPVVGFWLFPVDAFGGVPEGDYDDIRWSMKEVVDLRKHRPQLGVFRLPGGG